MSPSLNLRGLAVLVACLSIGATTVRARPAPAVHGDAPDDPRRNAPQVPFSTSAAGLRSPTAVDSQPDWADDPEISRTESVARECTTSLPTWQNASFPSQTGIFTAQFDAVPNDPSMEGVTALSAGLGATFSDFAVLVRFNNAGNIDVRDGDAYAADTAMPYAPGTWYHFRLVVDILTHSYSVYVTQGGGDEQTLATDYAFRSEQSDIVSLDNWGLIAEIGSHEVCDFAIRTVQNVTQGIWHVTVQDAIDAASSGDEIVLSAGTFAGVGNRDLDFGGKAITVRSSDPNDPNVVAATIIDCQGTTANPHRGFSFHSGESADSVVSGITITNGYAPEENLGNWAVAVGGAVFCEASSPTIANCMVSGNTAEACEGDQDARGGGICCMGGSSTIVNCTISENVASGDYVTGCGWGHGGGIYSDGATTISNCTITGNSATGYYPMGSGIGGGIRCSGTTTITACTVSDNQAVNGYSDSAGYGGGIDCSGSTTIEGCTVTANYAINGNATCGGGGGIYCTGNTTITDCVIAQNETGDCGGGIHCKDSPAVSDCTISGNHAAGSEMPYGGGGAVYAWHSPTITRCAMSGNDAPYGGAVFGCDGTVRDCTISENAASNGAGLYDCDGVIADSVISENQADFEGGGLIACDGMIVSCSISGNRAYFGGGFNWCSGPIANCAVTGNSANYGAGLAWCDGAIANCTISGNVAENGAGLGGCTGTIVNCIVWGNAPLAGDQLSGCVPPNYSCIQDCSGGEGNIDANPFFVRDPNDGGDGWGDNPDTPDIDEGANDDYGDLRLLSSSPCIDAGCNCGVPPDSADLDHDGDVNEPTPLDLDSDGRFFDDTQTPDAGSGWPPVVDMGAYEFGGTGLQPCIGDLDNDRHVGLADLASLLAHYGTASGATHCDGDLDCDGDVEEADLMLLLSVYGTTCE